MAHGTPDFWGAAPKGTTYGLADMAELAVRLGSFVNYDRRGEVIWLSSFDEGGREYIASGSGVGNEVYLECDQGLTRGLCLVLKTGAAAGSIANIEKVVWYPVLSKVGVEIAFTPTVELSLLWLRINMFDSAHLVKYTAQYDHAAGTIKVDDHTAGFSTVGTPGILRDTYSAYAHMKLVVDGLTGKYVRCMINDHTYDASAYSGVVSVDATAKSMSGVVRDTCGAAGAAEVRVDNMIITQNEPA